MNLRLSWNQWNSAGTLRPVEFTCGYCGKSVGGHYGYTHSHGGQIILCPNCGLPTFFHSDVQSPGPMIGRDIEGLSEDIHGIYLEIRDTAKNGNHTATALLGRKLIMHVAVESGAEEDLSFKEYVNFLADNHHIPPKADKLLEYMRSLGNEKNHEIKLGNPADSKKVIKFIESLLYFVYELETEFQDEE